MGAEKHELEKNEAAWDHVAQVKDHRCSVCSTRIHYCDREAFFSTGMCGYCAHQDKKDD